MLIEVTYKRVQSLLHVTKIEDLKNLRSLFVLMSFPASLTLCMSLGMTPLMLRFKSTKPTLKRDFHSLSCLKRPFRLFYSQVLQLGAVVDVTWHHAHDLIVVDQVVKKFLK